MLGVSGDLIADLGAVSEPIVRMMAEGALENSHAHVSVAITGVAGPGGGTPMKPVGTVHFATARANQSVYHRHEFFELETREEIQIAVGADGPGDAARPAAVARGAGAVERPRAVLEAARPAALDGRVEVGGQQRLQQARLELEVDLEGQLAALVVRRRSASGSSGAGTGPEIRSTSIARAGSSSRTRVEKRSWMIEKPHLGLGVEQGDPLPVRTPVPGCAAASPRARTPDSARRRRPARTAGAGV